VSAAILAALLAVLGLTIPVPGGFARLPGGEPPARGAAPRCLALSYEPPGGWEWLPDTLRIVSEVLFRNAADGAWYRADEESRWGWRPAGRDSIDLAAHHSPVLRLPVRGDTLAGRGGWPGHPSLYQALTRREFAVVAVEVPCPAAPRAEPGTSG
jgi:hypothetical protein